MEDFRSRAEAVKAAREHLWGTGPFAKRECLLPFDGTHSIHVSAGVNGHLVVIAFDNYGRTKSVKEA